MKTFQLLAGQSPRKHTLPFFLSMLLVIAMQAAAFSQQFTGSIPASTTSDCDNETYTYSFVNGALLPQQEFKVFLIESTWDGQMELSRTQVMTIRNVGTALLAQLEFEMTFSTGQIAVKNVNLNTTNQTTQVISGVNQGYYYLEGQTFQGGQLISTSALSGFPLFFKIGDKPELRINGKTGARMILLEGCDSGKVKLENEGTCGTDAMHLSVWEYDLFTEQLIGSEAHRSLNTSEINDLNASGLDIRTFSGNGTSVTITPGHTYLVKLSYQGYGAFWSSSTHVQYKSGNWDLSMYDNPEDDGFEPWNRWNQDIYESPDLWNRKYDPGAPIPGNYEVNQDPEYITISGNTNRLFVRVRNHGCVSSPANVPLRMFWTRARAGELWKDHWVANSNNLIPSAILGNVYGGSEITLDPLFTTPSTPYHTNSDPFDLPAIGAGQTWLMPYNDGVDWFPPNPADFDASNGSMAGEPQRPVICLLARINETWSATDKISWEPTGSTDQIDPYVRNNNNVVTRNTLIYDESDFLVGDPDGSWNYGFATIGVGNDDPTPGTIDICFDRMPLPNIDSDFLQYGVIQVALTEDLFDSWSDNGSLATNMVVSQGTLFELTDGSHACLHDITVGPDVHETVGMRFIIEGHTLPAQEEAFRYQISSTDEQSDPGSNSIIRFTVPTSAPSLPASDQKTGQQPTSVSPIQLAGSSPQVFPNPAKGVLNIMYPMAEEMGEPTFTIELFNVTGRLVLQRTGLVYNEVNQLDISELPIGMYTARIQSGTVTQSINIVVQ